MRIPRFSELDADAQELLGTIDRALAGAVPGDADLVASTSERLRNLLRINAPELKCLEHDLSAHAPHLWQTNECRWDTRWEYARLTAIKPLYLRWTTSNSMPLSSVLEQASASCGLPFGSFRTGAAHSASDPSLGRVQYPDASRIRRGLDSIGQSIDWERSYNIWHAIVLLTGILNVHPLADGNGRLARAFFNAALSENYIPLWSVWRCSRGGFQLFIRGVEIQENWTALIRYFASVVNLIKSIQEDTAHECYYIRPRADDAR